MISSNSCAGRFGAATTELCVLTLIELSSRALVLLALIIGGLGSTQAGTIVSFPNNEEMVAGYVYYHGIKKPFLFANENFIISERSNRNIECNPDIKGVRHFNVLILKYDVDSPISDVIDLKAIGGYIDPEILRDCPNVDLATVAFEFAGIRIRGMGDPDYLADISLSDYMAAANKSGERAPVPDKSYFGVVRNRQVQLGLSIRKSLGQKSIFDVEPRMRWVLASSFLKVGESFSRGRLRIIGNVKKLAVEVAAVKVASGLQDRKEAAQTVVSANTEVQNSTPGGNGGLGFHIEVTGGRRYQNGKMLYSDAAVSVYQRIDPVFPGEFCKSNAIRVSAVHNVNVDHEFTAAFLQRKMLELRDKISTVCDAKYFTFHHFVDGYDFLTFNGVSNGSTRETTRVALFPHPLVITRMTIDDPDWGADVDGGDLSAEYGWSSGIGDTYALALTVNDRPLTARRVLGKLNPRLTRKMESLAANWMSAEDLAEAKYKHEQAVRTTGEILGVIALMTYFSGVWSPCNDPDSTNTIGCGP